VRDVEARLKARAVGPASRAPSEKDVVAIFPNSFVSEVFLRVEGP
jgi:hypothetical protein